MDGMKEYFVVKKMRPWREAFECTHPAIPTPVIVGFGFGFLSVFKTEAEALDEPERELSVGVRGVWRERKAMKKTYRAYNLKGELLTSLWTNSDSMEDIEMNAFQNRLDRCEKDDVAIVYIVPDDPIAPIVEMKPNRSPRNLPWGQ